MTRQGGAERTWGGTQVGRNVWKTCSTTNFTFLTMEIWNQEKSTSSQFHQSIFKSSVIHALLLWSRYHRYSCSRKWFFHVQLLMTCLQHFTFLNKVNKTIWNGCSFISDLGSFTCLHVCCPYMQHKQTKPLRSTPITALSSSLLEIKTMLSSKPFSAFIMITG